MKNYTNWYKTHLSIKVYQNNKNNTMALNEKLERKIKNVEDEIKKVDDEIKNLKEEFGEEYWTRKLDHDKMKLRIKHNKLEKEKKLQRELLFSTSDLEDIINDGGLNLNDVTNLLRRLNKIPYQKDRYDILPIDKFLQDLLKNIVNKANLLNIMKESGSISDEDSRQFVFLEDFVGLDLLNMTLNDLADLFKRMNVQIAALKFDMLPEKINICGRDVHLKLLIVALFKYKPSNSPPFKGSSIKASK